jgi:four helix bundle protein
LSRQLKKASTSVPLNLAEGSGNRAGRRRNAYDIALGEARETLACLHTALAIGYIVGIAPSLQSKLDQIIGTLVNLLR